MEAARREKSDLVGVSYRLTLENGERLLAVFAEAAGCQTGPQAELFSYKLTRNVICEKKFIKPKSITNLFNIL